MTKKLKENSLLIIHFGHLMNSQRNPTDTSNQTDRSMLTKNMSSVKLVRKFLKTPIKDIIVVYLHMGKQVQANPIQ